MISEKEIIIEHYQSFFEGHDSKILHPDLDKAQKLDADFDVIRFTPGEHINLWVYCSIGASSIIHSNAAIHEYVLVSPIESDHMVDLLADVTHFHANNNLALGQALPLASPWLEGSQCDHCLLSLPYPFGEELEMMSVNGQLIHVAWLVPITKAEQDYSAANGVEALEQKFDDEELEFWKADRDSVV